VRPISRYYSRRYKSGCTNIICTNTPLHMLCKAPDSTVVGKESLAPTMRFTGWHTYNRFALAHLVSRHGAT
jgi:hypothetical protein